MTFCPQSVVSYRCNHGYLLHGPGTRSCAADQRWSGEQPECREINCGLPGPAGDGVIPNGWVEHSSTTLNSVITFRSVVPQECGPRVVTGDCAGVSRA